MERQNKGIRWEVITSNREGGGLTVKAKKVDEGKGKYNGTQIETI